VGLTASTVRLSLDELFGLANSEPSGFDSENEYQSGRNIPMLINYSELLGVSSNTDALIALLDELGRVKEALSMTITSPEYMVQR